MNPELHKMLMELEYKFDVELDEYFSLDEESKEELVMAIVDYFIPYAKSHYQAIYNIIRGLKIMIDEAEYFDEYEKADIFNRCRRKFERMTFL
jgi:hypothetical protein